MMHHRQRDSGRSAYPKSSCHACMHACTHACIMGVCQSLHEISDVVNHVDISTRCRAHRQETARPSVDCVGVCHQMDTLRRGMMMVFLGRCCCETTCHDDSQLSGHQHVAAHRSSLVCNTSERDLRDSRKTCNNLCQEVLKYQSRTNIKL